MGGKPIQFVEARVLREIRRRRKGGDTCAAIARALGLQKNTVMRICDHFGIPRRRYGKRSGPKLPPRIAAARVADVREYWLARDPSLRTVLSASAPQDRRSA